MGTYRTLTLRVQISDIWVYIAIFVSELCPHNLRGGSLVRAKPPE